MKNVILSLALSMSAFAAHASETVLMISRYNGGTYEDTATYNFRLMTHDVKLTHNNWDILFEAREDIKDNFRANTVTDDTSSIFDLGEGKCPPGDTGMVVKALTSKTTDNVPVVKGHCYLLLSKDTTGSAVVLFRVSEHIKSLLVLISEIQVLSKSGY